MATSEHNAGLYFHGLPVSAGTALNSIAAAASVMLLGLKSGKA